MTVKYKYQAINRHIKLMAPILSKSDQKKIVETLQAIKFSNECFMISKSWWDGWVGYVNEEGKHPGKISNADLTTSKTWNEPLNWTETSLRDDLEEGRDYMLVSRELWKRMKTWFGGGPEIDVFLVGKETDHRCEAGSPDLNPIKLPFIFMKKNAGQNFTCLVSLRMTADQFREFLKRKFGLRESAEISFRLDGEYVQLPSGDSTLLEIGITPDTLIKVKGEVPLPRDGGSGSIKGDRGSCEEEDIRRAVQASLQDMGFNSKLDRSLDGIHPLSYAKYKKLNAYLEEQKVPPAKVREEFQAAKKLVSRCMKEKMSLKRKDLQDTLSSLLTLEQQATDMIKGKYK